MSEEEKFDLAHSEWLEPEDDEDEPFDFDAYEDAQYEYLTDLERDE